MLSIALLLASLVVHGFAGAAATCDYSHTLTIDNEPDTPTPDPYFGLRAEGVQVNGPYGVAVDGTGNIYAADPSSEKVYRFDADGTQTLLFAPETYPERIAADAAGNIHLSSSGGIGSGGVAEFDASGTPRASVSGTDVGGDAVVRREDR